MKRTRLLVFLSVLSLLLSLTAFAQEHRASARTSVPAKSQPVTAFAPIDFRTAAAEEAKKPLRQLDEIEEIDAPQPPPPGGRKGLPIGAAALANASRFSIQSTPSFGTGVSPGPKKTFKAEFLSSTSIPPDTMGAVGTTHIVSVTNDRMRIQTRDGVEISRMTLTSFWAGVTIKGVAVSAFDPKVLFDRYNNRFIMVSSGNATSASSGALFAVTATADPTGTWYRWSAASDPASTEGSGGSGHWIDYPSVGHNKNWIVVNENTFNYTCSAVSPFPCSSGGFWGTQIFVLDKQAAYANTLGSSISLFEGNFNATCIPSATPETELACGFTMAPAITEDNTTDTVYLVEDWDSTAGQLRLSKITGTPSTPAITVGTQFPQSANAWRFDAVRISNKTTATTNGTTVTSSGGYMPQRQQSANLTSGTRVMANDSRVQNAVLRNGKLWCAHTVMLSATAQAAGVTIGGSGNPIDTHSGVQWWQIDPTNESGGTVPPLQRGRIEDATADNCHNGLGGQNIIAGRCTSTATQVGEFYAYPNISVNQSDDVFIGFTRFSPLTYPNSAYAIRRSTDAVNTTRDVVVFRPGQANYNIGAGTSTAVHPSNPTRQNRWGDYSAAQTDPLNDTDFWSVQEYSGTVRDFGIGLAGNWETWWAQVSPSATAPVTGGSLIISELRLRGPQGVRDEFVELYNPASTPVIVSTTDGSEGWALAYSNNGTTVTSVFAVVPNGTVIPAHGHFLVADNPDAAATPTTVYSLNSAAATQARGADSDTGWSLDLADNGGVAIFNTAITANFNNTTRLDSAGFSSIAAGLFKEGNGIPAVTAATPTGQMTFYRSLSSGSPADTGANENDFIFANTVVGETLGGTPKLGAAGPENLDGPTHLTSSTTLSSALLDPAVGTGDAPNVARDASVVTNGANGTITFRRTFTNSTGADLQRLRFRIVDLTTNPSATADLRVLTTGGSSVSVTGLGTVSVGGTTLETPPTQAAGGGLNGTLNVPAVTNTTPLTSGSTANIQFTAGVQTTGVYSFCLVAEGLVATSSSSTLCFAGNTENTAPSITPGSPISIARGTSAPLTPIATVSDGQDSAGTLTVTASSVPTGINVTSISNTAGAVTATIGATCAAAAGTNNVTLKVTDSNGATNTATFVVTVTVPATPTITPGGPTTFCAGGSVTLSSSAAAGYQWYLNGNAIGGATNQNYIATLSGTYTVAAVANGCEGAQSAGTVVTVNAIPSTPTATNGGPYVVGQTIALFTPTVASAAYAWTGPNGFTSTLQNPTVPTAQLVNAGVYSVTVTVNTCTSAAGTTTVIIGLRKSDLNGDGKSDIVLQNTGSNSVAAWLMDDNTIIEGKVVANPVAGVQIVATGDLDGDGKADIIVKNNSSGAISMWKMNGTTLVSGTVIATPNIATRVVGTYDFNHDGKADIVLQNNSSGAVSLWLMNGASLTSGVALGTQPSTTRAVGVGHYGGDAIIFQDTTTNTISRWIIASNAVSSNQVIATPAIDWKLVAFADFDNDTNDDLALQNTSTRTVAVWLIAANGQTISLGANVATPAAGWQVVGAGDYDGNNKGDLLLNNSSTNGIAQWQMDGTVIARGWNISTVAGWKPLGN
ncbi:MAG: hypothetical protein QOI24_4342 [Acidobacteriota bacterium]|jgi:hypothetical protein|nr:hypothetical protein [Acidobacteriota bacterium]